MSREEEFISPVATALAGEARDVRRALQVLGEILTDAAPRGASFDGFLYSSLGRAAADVVCESSWLSNLSHITVGLALGRLIDEHCPEIGPADDDEAPTWGSVTFGDQQLAPPSALAAYFPAGQLAPVGVVVRICDSGAYGGSGRILVYSAPEDREHAATVLDAIMSDAEGAKSLFRGKALAATAEMGLAIEFTELAEVTRDDVIVPGEVWAEIDLNVASVTVHRELMERLGLGVRRGVLLAGPPGVGKSVISQVIARELIGDFTVIIVDARAGQNALSGVYKEARSMGPTVVIIEDIDLIVTNRHAGYGPAGVLSEFLAAMDAHPMAPLLTLASTNDTATLDAAAIRSARFDSIIELGYPGRDAAARILQTYLRGVPGGADVDTAHVAMHFGPDVSGADIREVVRRTVLSCGGVVGTSELVTTVQGGRFKAQLPEGNYL